MTELVRIHRDAKGTIRWLEPAIERIRAMSARFEGDPDALADGIWKQVAEKSPLLGLFVGIEDDQVVGHVVADIRQWDGRWLCWITQVEHDRRAGRTLIDAVLAALTDWVEQFNFSFKNQGVRVDEMLFTTPRMSEAWAEHSGFAPYRYVMRRKLPTALKGAG